MSFSVSVLEITPNEWTWHLIAKKTETVRLVLVWRLPRPSGLPEELESDANIERKICFDP